MSYPHPAASPAARVFGRPLMLVSADASASLRTAVRKGERPCPEYLLLEGKHEVDLFERRGAGRRWVVALSHVLRALPSVRGASSVLSDGEHVGLPLAVAMRLLRIRTPHVMLGHHLNTRPKAVALRYMSLLPHIARILVHSNSQAEGLAAQSVPRSKVAVIRYGVDTEFWSPQPQSEEALVVSAGREHRDHETLVKALGAEPVRVFITDSSTHSPHARRHAGRVWPPNVERRRVSYVELRMLYAAASVVVVPMMPTDFPAGITATLEAMSMAKAVVVTDTAGLRGVVQHRVTGLLVPPGDAHALSDAVASLLSHPEDRLRLGSAARTEVLKRWSVGRYAEELAGQLSAIRVDGNPRP